MSHPDKNNKCISIDKSASVGHCESEVVGTPITPQGERLIRVPVTLASLNVSTSLVANIHFPEPVLEIKDIKKRVKIIQCRLLTPGAEEPSTFSTGPFQLFLKGFVRKNIQYASPIRDASGQCVSSHMKSFTTDVPFECVTTVTLTNPVELPTLNTRNEFDYFRAQPLGHGFPEKDELLSSDLSQFHQQSTQFYNQLPHCELVSSQILEWDEATDRQSLPGNSPFEEGYFHNMVEKMFLQFTVRILQNQQVRIDAL